MPHRVVIAAIPGVEMLDVVGPYEVLVYANHGAPRYRIEVAAVGDLAVSTAHGLPFLAHRRLEEIRSPVHTIIVPGAHPNQSGPEIEILAAWLKRRSTRVERIVSVCTGAFLLAKAGLLNGRRATTHWAFADLLAKRFPEVTVDAHPIFIKDGPIYTSAGITAGMDLTLALVEEDYGPKLALAVAQQLVVFLKRPGSQAQFSRALDLEQIEPQNLKDLVTWMLEHLNEDLSVDALAHRAAMSRRNFTRVFTKVFGQAPARYVETLRIEAAKRRLETSDRSLAEIAERVGFGGESTLRRVFHKHMGSSPATYRARFASAWADPA